MVGTCPAVRREGGTPYKTANGYTFPYDYLDLAVTPSGTNIVIWGEGPN